MGGAVAGACGYARDSVASVELPKRVVIKNFRLGLVLAVLRACAAAFVLWLVLGTRSYLNSSQPQGYAAKWVSSPADAYDEAALEDFNSRLCTEPGRFDYQYDAEWRYRNYTCVTRAKEDRIGWKEGDDMLYIPMSYEETSYVRRPAPALVWEGGAPRPRCDLLTEPCEGGWQNVSRAGARDVAPLCECRKSQLFFVAGVSSLAIGLEHYYEVGGVGKLLGPGPSSQASMVSCKGGRWRCEKQLRGSGTASKELEMMTLVVAGDQNTVIHSSTSPERINIPLHSILQASGMSLDAHNSDTVPNLFWCGTPGSDPATCREDVEPYALIRQTGLEIQFDMQYLNHWRYPAGYAELEGHRGPLCYIQVKVVPLWAGRPRTDCHRPPESATSRGSCTQVYSYGVQAMFVQRGSFGYFDPELLAVTLGAGMVYFMVPLSIVSALAMYCLGPFSRVYASAAKQEVNVDFEIVSLAAKMMTTSVACRALSGEGGRLSKEALLDEVHRAFACEALDEEERGRLAALVLWKLGARDRHAGGGPVGRPAQAGRAGEQRQGEEEEEAGAGGEQEDVNVQDIVAYSHNMVRLRDAVQLFDQDRPETFLEKLFKPEMHLRKGIMQSPTYRGAQQQVRQLQQQQQQHQQEQELTGVCTQVSPTLLGSEAAAGTAAGSASGCAV